MKYLKSPKFSLLFIILIAALLRFNNLNWDSNFHLHPDERFLTMVGNAMKVPQTINEYLDPATSEFNPANIGYQFFVYGVLPLTMNKLLAIGLNTDTYNDFVLQGRMLSGVFDILIIIVLYHFVHLLERKFKLSTSLKYWSAFFYAIAVLPIQLSHFFAVDTFLSFFMLTSFYFAVRYYMFEEEKDILFSAIFMGLALASKINAVYVLPLNFLFIAYGSVQQYNRPKPQRSLLKVFFTLLFFFGFYFLITYIIVRVAGPYYFQTSNLFDPTFSKLFVDNIASLKSFEGPDVWYPPAIQWISKPPVWFSLKNVALYGVGIPYFVFLLVGLWASFKLHKSTSFNSIMGVITLWVVGLFLYQSIQFVKALRYFIFLYPFFAFYAAVGFLYIKNYLSQLSSTPTLARRMLYILLMASVLIWPIAFSSIYLSPHSRVEASQWMYKNVPNNSVLLTEHWDDGLPLPMPNPEGKTYIFKEMPVFGMDNDDKWRQIDQLMREGDYYVLSSNRGWGSMPTVPEKYPKMGQFYDELFTEKLGYEKVAEFTSYPRLKIGKWEVQFPDDNADETFTVYDHPKVMIFRNMNK